MKKNLLALFLVLIVTGTASAAVVDITDYSYGGGELRLYQVYNNLFGTTYTTNVQLRALEDATMISSGIFAPGEYTVSLVGRYSAAKLNMGYYDADGYNSIFSNLPSESKYYTTPINVTFDADKSFGLMGEGLWNGGGSLGQFYSEGSKNPSGLWSKYHFVFFDTPDPGLHFVGYEDLQNGDWDYNDGIFLMRDPRVVPEPASMMMFGLGALGLLGLRKKRR